MVKARGPPPGSTSAPSWRSASAGLSTIQSADQILVLDHGRIVERGTHFELLEAQGRYRQLYDKQYRFESNRFINPGEDFTPEPPPRDIPRPASREGGLPRL